MKLFDDGRAIRVGLSGSGYISAGLLRTLSRFDDVTVSAVLTGRHPSRDHQFPRPDLLVREADELVERSDLIVECSGSVTRAVKTVAATFAAGLPVVTVNAEFQVTVGHLFTSHGLLTEAEGDQPGALAAMAEQLALMGFQPMVYGNIKTFLDHNPTRENMRRQAELHGISQQQVTSFTDGTKLHVEVALVANGLNAGVCPEGLFGVQRPDLEGCITELIAGAERLGIPISDFCMPKDTDAHVFIVATHPDPVGRELAHYKLGPGPYYRFSRNRHLGHFEVPRTIKRVIESGRPLINNGITPQAMVAAVTKTQVAAGTTVASAVGSESFRGVAVRAADNPRVLPIGLMEGCVLIRDLPPGSFVEKEDVQLAEPLVSQLSALEAL
jgi:predicted homoserine dehydrogenase-like protein